MSKCTYNYNGVEYSELEFKKILKDLELPLSELSQEDLNLFKEHVMFIHDIQNYRLLNRYTVIHNNGYYDTAIRKVLIPVDSINKENILANIIKFKGLNPLFNLYHLFNEHTIKLIDSTPEIDSKDRLYEYRLAMLLQNNVENTWLNKLLLDLQIGINNTLNTNYDLEVIKNFLSHNINIVESQTVLPDTTESIDVESLLNQLGLNGKVESEQEPNAEIVNYVTEIRELANTDLSNIQRQSSIGNELQKIITPEGIEYNISFENIERVSNLIINKLSLLGGDSFRKKNFVLAKRDIFYTSDRNLKFRIYEDILTNIFDKNIAAKLKFNDLENSLKLLLNKENLIDYFEKKLYSLSAYTGIINAADLEQLQSDYRLLKSFLRTKDKNSITNYSDGQQDIIKMYLPTVFTNNKTKKFKSDKQELVYLGNKVLKRLKNKIELEYQNRDLLKFKIENIKKKVETILNFINIVPNYEYLIEKKIQNQIDRVLNYKNKLIESNYQNVAENIKIQDLYNKSGFYTQETKIQKEFEKLNNKKDVIVKLFPELKDNNNLISNSVDILTLIINSNSEFKALAEHLLPFAIKHNVPIYITDNYKGSNDSSGHSLVTTDTVIDKNTNQPISDIISEAYIEININSQRFSTAPDQIILHEIVHSLSQIYLASVSYDLKEKDPYNKIINYINNELSKRDVQINSMVSFLTQPYGLSNVHELFSETLTNIEFQELLKSLPPIESKIYRNLFDQIIGLIAKLFNIEQYSNLYEQLEDLIYASFDKQTELSLHLDDLLKSINKDISEIEIIKGKENKKNQLNNNLIRLYRIENTNIPYDESIEGIVSKREIIGQFFTDSINTVANYLKKNQKEDGINLVYVDIPKSDLDKYHVSNNEFSKTMDVESDNWIIPQSIARNYVDLSSVTKVTGNFLTLNKAKKELTEIINNLPEPKLNNNFIGNYSTEGRGTFEGDGKDKAMRNQAVGFIGELNPNKEDRFDSSTYGSFKHFNNNPIEKERYLENVPEDTSNGNKIMLALNGSIADTDILQKTKDKILELHNRGFEFLVGDMPGGENRIGDDKFINYLKSIGANFTVFGSGNSSRLLYQRVELTEQQRQNIQELKQLEPAYAVASNEKVQEFIDTIYPEIETQFNKEQITNLNSPETINKFNEFIGRIDYQLVNQEGIIATEKTIRDLAARISDRIGIPYKIISDRTQEFKGKLENGVAVINLAYATLDTVFHEVAGHSIIRALKLKSEKNIDVYLEDMITKRIITKEC